MYQERGVTLLETMVVVSLVAVLAAVAVPGLRALILDTRQVAHVADVVGSLNYARSEAVKRGHKVAVCPSDDGATCLGASRWEEGWIVFADTNGNGSVDLQEDVLRIYERFDDGGTMRGPRVHITYQSTGFSAGYNGTLSLCDSRGVDGSRRVIISNQGRVRVAPLAASCP